MLVNYDTLFPVFIWQYKANKSNGKLHDEFTAAWTYPYNTETYPYSHSEFMFPDGTVFSSASRMGGEENKIGVRFADPNIILRHVDRWDVYIKWVSLIEVIKYYRRAVAIEGRPYYWAGLVLDFTLPFGWTSNLVGEYLNHWYCSQSVWFVITGKRKRVSPRRLQTWSTKLGYIITENTGGIFLDDYGKLFKESLQGLHIDISFLSNHTSLDFVSKRTVRG